MIFIYNQPTAPTAKGTAGCLIVWKKAVLFAQKLYIQSSLIGALARFRAQAACRRRFDIKLLCFCEGQSLKYTHS
jgi:hypothetical protein